MNRATLRTLAAASAAAIVLTGAALERRDAVITDITAITSASHDLSGALATTGRTHNELVAVLADREATAAVGAQLVEARTPFIAAIGSFSTALAGAKGKVDASSHLTRVTAAQALVLAERDRPDAVAAATTAVTAATGEVNTAVKAYDDEQRRIAEAAAAAAAASRSRGASGGWSGGASVASTGGGGGGGNSGGNAVDRARAALNQVGGGHVPVRAYDGNCQGRYADACSLSSGYIAVAPAIGSYSQGRLLWAMAHELAHQYQFGAWGALQRSGTFSALFGGNFEKLANCMAAARGYGSGNVSCSGEQLNFAGGVWNNNIAG